MPPAGALQRANHPFAPVVTTSRGRRRSIPVARSEISSHSPLTTTFDAGAPPRPSRTTPITVAPETTIPESLRDRGSLDTDVGGEAAHHVGASQVLYLDTTDTYIEEAGAMNHYHVTRDGRLVIPTFTDSILRSVTSESVLALGKEALGIAPVQERIKLEDFLAGVRSGAITEAGGFGTAAVISPVGAYVFDDGTELKVASGGIGEHTRRVYEVVSSIQRGTRPAPAGWLFKAPRVA